MQRNYTASRWKRWKTSMERIFPNEAAEWIKYDPSDFGPYSKMTVLNCKAYMLEQKENGFDKVTYFIKKKEDGSR